VRKSFADFATFYSIFTLVFAGKRANQTSVCREVVKPKRLVFTFAWDEESGNSRNETPVIVEFEEVDGKTRMTFRQGPLTSEESREGYREGWSNSFDRPHSHLRPHTRSLKLRR
jgi:uncharacterized protein YndB with AHSA1/START domain